MLLVSAPVQVSDSCRITMYHRIKEMATIKLPFSIKFQIIIEVDKLLIIHSLECPRVRLLDFRLVFHIVVVFGFNLFPLPDSLSQDTKGDRMENGSLMAATHWMP